MLSPSDPQGKALREEWVNRVGLLIAEYLDWERTTFGWSRSELLDLSHAMLGGIVVMSRQIVNGATLAEVKAKLSSKRKGVN